MKAWGVPPPSIGDVPPLKTILLPADPSLGITPIGEGPNCGMSACVANAVMDTLAGLGCAGAAREEVQVNIPVTAEQLIGRLRAG